MADLNGGSSSKFLLVSRKHENSYFKSFARRKAELKGHKRVRVDSDCVGVIEVVSGSDGEAEVGSKSKASRSVGVVGEASDVVVNVECGVVDMEISSDDEDVQFIAEVPCRVTEEEQPKPPVVHEEVQPDVEEQQEDDEEEDEEEDEEGYENQTHDEEEKDEVDEESEP
ncbi:myelin transcription factor 1-like [Chenopodium quinoa]|uniref:myelin transcription factor 1-like n=1 Tax=Chenopodium quinoa TaxID=63459 RepID=UPI000B796693|nr:myelin transcription factor 1-like [Chenopodium quinoa]